MNIKSGDLSIRSKHDGEDAQSMTKLNMKEGDLSLRSKHDGEDAQSMTEDFFCHSEQSEESPN